MFILIGLAAAAAASACIVGPAPELGAATLCSMDAVAYQPMLGGGWRAVETDDEGVQAAASFAAQQLGSELSAVETAQRQVVAGLNFRLTLTLEDGRKFNVVVFRALNGTYSLTSSEEVNDGGSGDSPES